MQNRAQSNPVGRDVQNVVNMTQARRRLTMEQQTSSQTNASGFIQAVHGIRYQVNDVARARFHTPQYENSRGAWRAVVTELGWSG